MRRLTICCAVAALFAATGGRASADPIIGNLNGSSSSGYFSGYNLGPGGGTSVSIAEGFTMTSSYTLTDAILALDVHSATLALDIYADNGSNAPGSLLLTMTNPANLQPSAGFGLYTFTAPTQLTLQSGKTYWLNLHSTATADQFDTWVLRSPQASPSGVGATDKGQERSLSTNPPPGPVFTESRTAYQLDGTLTSATPEPATTTLLGFGAVGLLASRLRRRKPAAA